MNPQNAMKALELMADTVRAAARRVSPADAEAIKRMVASHGDEILNAAREGGFTFNPRAGKMLEAGVDRGFMMARQPEVAGLNRRAGATAQDLQDFVADPRILEQLRRGAYLGGWEDNGQLVLDAATRYMNPSRAILDGAGAAQDAAFDLGRINTLDTVDNIPMAAANKLALQRLAEALGLAGTGAAASYMDR